MRPTSASTWAGLWWLRIRYAVRISSTQSDDGANALEKASARSGCVADVRCGPSMRRQERLRTTMITAFAGIEPACGQHDRLASDKRRFDGFGIEGNVFADNRD